MSSFPVPVPVPVLMMTNIFLFLGEKKEKRASSIMNLFTFSSQWSGGIQSKQETCNLDY